MLEKIGLPPKPSLRGNNWVVDASHCQGCSSQFTFINRKHHCRKCGGLFCNSCTNQRMSLRGQGDSPVRICDPCKKLEEAARFEMRHGHKRAGKGSSRHTPNKDDEVLQSILSGDRLPHDQQPTCIASSSSSLSQDFSTKDVLMNETAIINTPEELRQQAMDEKKKHRTLKAEGKSEEALRAFKRGKELERQAAALEVQIRKNRKRSSSSSSNMSDESNGPVSKKQDDIVSELKEMGWSDMDIYETDKKPTTMSLEGELSVLLREVSQKPNTGKRIQASDKSQVIAHKKKALEFKREGKLVEAKEELKKAKVLEKQIEEQEFLMDCEDSDDDEISSLIRSLGSADTQELSMGGANFVGSNSFDFDDILSVHDDLGGDLKVTEDDMEDPEMEATLKSLGWSEEDNPDHADNREAKHSEVQSLKREALMQKRAGNTAEAMEMLKKAKIIEKELDGSLMVQSGLKTKGNESKTVPRNKLMIQRELLGLKKNALALRREGRLDEAEEELRKCKVLENQLEEFDNKTQIGNDDFIVDNDSGGDDVTDLDMQDPNYLSVLKNLGWQEDEEDTQKSTSMSQVQKPTGKSKRNKVEIQKELLSLKRKALALRRQGESEQADELLETAKELEAELVETESSSLKRVASESNAQIEPNIVESPLMNLSSNTQLDPKSDTADDMGLGISNKNVPENKPSEMVNADKIPSNSLHQEILAHKKKAVAFKREGRLTEAKDELRQAKALEKHLEEETVDFSGPDASPSSEPTPGDTKPLSGRDRFKLQQESLNHKRTAFKLRREGRAEEADAEFKLAKAIEAQLEESGTGSSSGHGSGPTEGGVHVEDFLDPQLLSALAAIGISDASVGSQGPEMIEDDGGPHGIRGPELKKPVADMVDSAAEEKTELEKKIKEEKMKALNLKRSGKHAEALDALRRAKLFERKLNSSNS
ncbi:hypothetical protein DM860_001918 [Cuscuta australis]|uniref:FYVE-type domain-containing protein n=1 Tax=Cuscuta australis TaxID=267555 RepID=A0A328DV83_9ASTE|nr:hypothetical protein DM860_001918 [Cuscuta australis]